MNGSNPKGLTSVLLGNLVCEARLQDTGVNLLHYILLNRHIVFKLSLEHKEMVARIFENK